MAERLTAVVFNGDPEGDGACLEQVRAGVELAGWDEVLADFDEVAASLPNASALIACLGGRTMADCLSYTGEHGWPGRTIITASSELEIPRLLVIHDAAGLAQDLLRPGFRDKVIDPTISRARLEIRVCAWLGQVLSDRFAVTNS